MENHITSLALMDDLSINEVDIERSKTVFSKYYEYLPYKRQNRESVLDVLYSRETGTSSGYSHRPLRAQWSSSTRKNQYFYMRSLCAAKFGSSTQPLLYPITNVSESTIDGDKRLRPRQFEYHPSDSSLMAVGTLDGEVIVLNHETGNVVSCVFPFISLNSILGLSWLKNQPSKVRCFYLMLYVTWNRVMVLPLYQVIMLHRTILTKNYSTKLFLYILSRIIRKSGREVVHVNISIS